MLYREPVEVKGISFPNVGADSSFAPETSYEVADGETTFAFWVGGEESSALVGTPIPTGVFSFVDVLGQSSDAQRGSYRLVGLQPQTALPVDMAELEAVRRDASVELTWITMSEPDNAGFRVQHQTRGGWRTLGFVDSKASGGTTTEPQSYRYTVGRRLSPGTHRFRLQQEDLDGTTSLSEVVALKVAMEEALRLGTPVPNPASARAVVSFSVKEPVETSVALYNVLGQRVEPLFEGTPEGGQSHTVDISAETLSSGVYFVRLQASGQTQTERLTIVR